MAASKNLSKTFVWILLGMLIVGLAGFGATNLSGTIRTVGHVGDQLISVDTFARELQREIRAVEAQTGQAMPMEQARALGLDQVVLARLVALASIDHETAELGLSIGDENLQREILQVPAFQGIDGQFDREGYRFALRNAGINEAEFESDLRAEASRTLVQGAIVGGVQMPPALANVIVQYIGARRSFTWAQLTAGDLAEPLAEPTTAELQAYYDANIGDFTLPESKRITYAILTPDMIIDQVEVDETALRALFEDRADEYNKPERRLVERLVFGDAAKAGSAKAQLDVNGTTFELLVQDRGLDLGDIDLGDVTRPELDDAADAVFAASVGDIVGPLPSALGPALFRVNAVLPAQITTFEEAHDDLQDELASDRARRLIDTQAQTIDDLLAGGATLQELPDETDMTLGQIDWTADTFEDIAAYGAFRQAAAALTLDDFPEVEYLDDGGVFAMRLDEVLDARPQPFDDALPAVIEGWSESATAEALSAQVTSAITALASGGDFAAAGLSPRVENGLTRSAFIEETPPQFMSEVFQMNIGEVRVLPAGATVVIVRLTETLPADTGGDMGRLRDAYEAELNQSLSQALFDAFARDAQLRARPQIDQRALNAVLTSFQ